MQDLKAKLQRTIEEFRLNAGQEPNVLLVGEETYRALEDCYGMPGFVMLEGLRVAKPFSVDYPNSLSVKRVDEIFLEQIGYCHGVEI